MVVPALPALFWGTASDVKSGDKHFRYQRPLFSAEFSSQAGYRIVFLFIDYLEAPGLSIVMGHLRYY